MPNPSGIDYLAEILGYDNDHVDLSEDVLYDWYLLSLTDTAEVAQLVKELGGSDECRILYKR